MTTFHRLVRNTLGATVTNNFLWFALTFWVYLETRSVIATSVIGGGYMLLTAASGLVAGTFVDRHRRKVSMLLSSALSLGAYLLAAVVWALAPAGALRDLGHPLFWLFITLILGGAIAGNLRTVALSTTVTLLVPEPEHDRANGLIGTVTGIGFALTSVGSGLAIGRLGMGWSVVLAVVATAVTALHLLTIRVDEPAPEPVAGDAPRVDVRGALRAVRAVDGLLALLAFTTLNNFLSGTYMALMDPYGLSLTSVETWGMLWGVVSLGFIIGGIVVARRGLGPDPVRTLLLANVALWVVCVVFPLRASIVLLAGGMFVFLLLIPAVEAAEQTVLQRVVPFHEQGRVMGFAQSLETAASPVSAFVLGPVAQTWVMPFMTDGAGARAIGSWFGTGPDRGLALVFVVTGLAGLIVTILALRSRATARLSARYAATDVPAPEMVTPAAAPELVTT
jgi:DHA3 family multidrug efflux protein-like MFS transporter